ncbi:PAS domain-containing sensor histidine kinase [Roseospirillum parvum]|uniref:PAS domain-containing sensor histidine kinase n=1 Tax=Roseospirillum parvum TaxID=83401 RepID=UPI0015A496DC|nr:PAS domain S-box protein [Roseospirillum parvum]
MDIEVDLLNHLLPLVALALRRTGGEPPGPVAGIDHGLIAAIPVPLFVKDEAGRYVAANESFAAFLGLPRAAIIGHTAHDVSPPDLAVIYHQADLDLLAAGGAQTYEADVQSATRGRRRVVFHKAVMACTGSSRRCLVGLILDVTERHQLERERAELAREMADRERNFRTFFETLNDMVFVLSPEGAVMHANQAALHRLGHALDHLVGRRLTDLHPPAEAAEVARAIERARGGQSTHCEVPYLSAGDATIPAETRFWPGRWDGAACLFAAARDLSREAAAEHQTRVWFERLFRRNPAPMILSDVAERRLIDANDAFLETFGFDKAEVLGRRTVDLGILPDLEGHARLAERLLAEGRVSSVELPLKRRDGQRLYGLFSGEVIARPEGPVFLSLWLDTTEARQAKDALAESEERLRLALDAARDGIWDWDTLSGQVTWSPRAYTMLGFPPDAFTVDYATWADMVHPDDRAAAAAAVQEGMANGQGFAVEFRLKCHNGDWLWVLGRGRPVAWDDAGRVARAVGTHTEIEAMKRTEADLERARREAERASQAKSEFLAGMSHELRTPLNSIIGFASLLLEMGERSLSPGRGREYLRDIEGSGRHLLGLINDILDLSAIEAGKVELASETLDVAEVLDEAARLIAPRAADAGVVFEVQAPSGLPSLLADRRRVLQVLLNLLSNAVKFTPAGGRVGLTAAPEPGGGLVIGVEDSGIGMSDAGLAKALSPFEQVDNVLSRRHDGIGLGLPLTRHLMEMHGGRLELTSTPGQGTIARARFPAGRVGAGG